ncbi:MAG: DegT/DnrJ/EryC1/StrS family aminotransferase [Rhodospirillaceae bacterium]
MIPHNRPTISDEERAAVTRVLASHWLAQGREVEAFEDEVCEFVGLPRAHAVAVSSGSAALYLALRTLGAEGKNVALPVYACAALSNAVALVGATARFMDLAAESPNIDLAALDRTGADMAVVAHMFGLPVAIASGKMPMIEDCAQAIGARIGDVAVGLQGDIGVFSFYATKLITAGGQGGMIVSKDRALVEAVRDYRAFDQREDRRPRFNFQMTDLQAAIGRAQLQKLPAFLGRRAEIFSRYREAGLPLLDVAAPAKPVRYRAVVKTSQPERLIAALAAHNIKAIVPVETWELLDAPAAYPAAEAFTRTSVSLPIYPSLTDGELDNILGIIQDIA